MKVLLDHCVPRRFCQLLTGHDVRTAYEMGWAALKNGQLLAAAAPHLDVLVTVDQNLQYQQNLATLAIGVIILEAKDNRLETLRPFAPYVLSTLATGPDKKCRVIEAGGAVRVLS